MKRKRQVEKQIKRKKDLSDKVSFQAQLFYRGYEIPHQNSQKHN